MTGWWSDTDRRKTEILWKEPAQVKLRLPQIPDEQIGTKIGLPR